MPDVMLRGGRFVISLDFELHWGVRASRSLASYRRNLMGVREVVPALLSLFKEFEIHATWATVGMLFFDTRKELLSGIPSRLPSFEDPRVSSYKELNAIGSSERDDPFHYAPSLIRLIAENRQHEIGTHTFSHYFCLEPGADPDSFRDDLAAAQHIAAKYDVRLRSLVFPGNQISELFVQVARDGGIETYRGTESAWLYRPSSRGAETTIRRGFRLLDAYLMLSSHNCYSSDELVRSKPLNIPSSRFLRPYLPALAPLDRLREWRITTDLEYAARNDLIYHLWWHPHNFGVNLEQNLRMLRRVLTRFALLRERYGMLSVTLSELKTELNRFGGAHG
jgi:peptidoglycan/xylan/chitin deacetylase (PgdA/CDA1 family)